MTDDRNLRERLARIDPASSMGTESATGSAAQEMMEKIIKDKSTSTAAKPIWYTVAAAAVLVVVVGIGLTFDGGGEAPIAAPATTQVPQGETVELSLGASNSLASCIVPSAEVLADVPMALAGTATAIEGEYVTLTVDRWYKGGDAATVRLFAQSGLEALIGTIEFESGGSYLLSAFDGTVNYCGLSGPATSELQALYAEAFGD